MKKLPTKPETKPIKSFLYTSPKRLKDKVPIASERLPATPPAPQLTPKQMESEGTSETDTKTESASQPEIDNKTPATDIQSQVAKSETPPIEASVESALSETASESEFETQLPAPKFNHEAALSKYLTSRNGPNVSWAQQKQNTIIDNIMNANRRSRARGGPVGSDQIGVQELATLADGSPLVRVKGSCFVLKEDEAQGTVWMGTACPNSTNPLRQQLKESFKKFGLEQ